VSPIPTDTEHSIGTLRTACAIAGYGDADMLEEKDEVRPFLPVREERVTPAKWDADQLFAWLTTVQARTPECPPLVFKTFSLSRIQKNKIKTKK